MDKDSTLVAEIGRQGPLTRRIVIYSTLGGLIIAFFYFSDSFGQALERTASLLFFCLFGGLVFTVLHSALNAATRDRPQSQPTASDTPAAENPDSQSQPQTEETTQNPSNPEPLQNYA
ncbi:hypothetical protein [Puniceicoccus vermicola]|uniref:Uncharacterized protein n=1 Tax=Puniceicoccus vermicola TaxID=388746 RepID=A0A7X1E3D0_9BACT|nr:hypothetical protein [Puniceicoccus vermicola]MBC2601340.1 hypothetical protein [Puniceicoccus vermicola]